MTKKVKAIINSKYLNYKLGVQFVGLLESICHEIGT